MVEAHLGEQLAHPPTDLYEPQPQGIQSCIRAIPALTNSLLSSSRSQ